jgi:hypothetical protein
MMNLKPRALGFSKLLAAILQAPAAIPVALQCCSKAVYSIVDQSIPVNLKADDGARKSLVNVLCK